MRKSFAGYCPVGHTFDKRLNTKTCPDCGRRLINKNPTENHGRELDEIVDELLYIPIEPVCGWLACIDGPRRGQSFALHSGKNFIGRADDMDVQILGDMEVSRQNHAIVAYDPKNRQFMLVPGESDGLVYLNGQSVYQATLLTDMSQIQIGNTILVFRPLCGDNFDWE